VVSGIDTPSSRKDSLDLDGTGPSPSVPTTKILPSGWTVTLA